MNETATCPTNCTFAYHSVIPPTHCPYCGRCLGCGGPQFVPYRPWQPYTPWYPYRPTWTSEITIADQTIPSTGAYTINNNGL